MMSMSLCAVGTGISMLQFANMNLTRNIFVVGFSIFMGLSVPQYFDEFALRAGHGPVHTNARWVSDPHACSVTLFTKFEPPNVSVLIHIFLVSTEPRIDSCSNKAS